MIDVLAADDRRGFGLAAALAIEGISARPIARAADFDAELLIVARDDADAATAALAARVPTIVVGGPPALVSALFDVRDVRMIDGPVSIALEAPVWSASTRETARSVAPAGLHLPTAPAARPSSTPAGTVLAGAVERPWVVARGNVVWSLVDVGTALADLLDERHARASAAHATPAWLRPALALYYRAPEPLRRLVQRRTYARLAATLDATSSTYPVDATGWLLLELVTALVRRAAGRVVRVGRWPAPFGAAAILSHDVEPTAFAYGAGLDQLLSHVAASGHPATFGLVAGPASRALGSATTARLAGADLLCHGLEHQGETVAGNREEIAAGLVEARTQLEACVGRPVRGFRSPRLDRSRELLWALDQTGFEHDSSFPDVDRENVSRFGAGVRLSMPYRPPIEDAGRVRASRCLELPVSAPDCVQPLFAGDDERALRAAVERKIAFVRASGGLYTGIVHGGVFGPADAERRGEHLRFVRRALDHPDLWLTTASEVAGWWRRREGVRIRRRGAAIEVENVGTEPVSGLRVVVDGDAGSEAHAVPALAPGARATVPADGVREAACR